MLRKRAVNSVPRDVEGMSVPVTEAAADNATAGILETFLFRLIFSGQLSCARYPGSIQKVLRQQSYVLMVQGESVSCVTLGRGWKFVVPERLTASGTPTSRPVTIITPEVRSSTVIEVSYTAAACYRWSSVPLTGRPEIASSVLSSRHLHHSLQRDHVEERLPELSSFETESRTHVLGAAVRDKAGESSVSWGADIVFGLWSAASVGDSHCGTDV
ncbi:hypothetical protein J6590_045897 [Homalodisca vitripennis]|nr:hypothetical protein J6590_045897 [Homalodisca vitripennis]